MDGFQRRKPVMSLRKRLSERIGNVSRLRSRSVRHSILSGLGSLFLPLHVAGQQFVYTANGDANTVSAFKVDPMTGGLTSVPGSPFPAGPNATWVAASST